MPVTPTSVLSARKLGENTECKMGNEKKKRDKQWTTVYRLLEIAHQKRDVTCA